MSFWRMSLNSTFSPKLWCLFEWCTAFQRLSMRTALKDKAKQQSKETVLGIMLM